MAKSDSCEELTRKHLLFIDEYFRHNMNATEAYCQVYPNAERRGARVSASKLLSKSNIRAEIDRRMAKKAISADEVLARLSGMARASIAPFIKITDDGRIFFDFSSPDAAEYLYLIKKVKMNRKRLLSYDGGDEPKEWEVEWTEVELHDSQAALEKIGRYHRLFGGTGSASESNEQQEADHNALVDAIRGLKNEP